MFCVSPTKVCFQTPFLGLNSSFICITKRQRASCYYSHWYMGLQSPRPGRRGGFSIWLKSLSNGRIFGRSGGSSSGGWSGAGGGGANKDLQSGAGSAGGKYK